MNKITAKTHWVWTSQAEETWDNRYKGQQRIAGKPIKGEAEESTEVEPAWLLRGYVIDASDYISEDGQLDLFEILEG
ncbi:hypothetical protein [Paenibacillus alvei]|uniref:hypothetical protein n=1 Tax=Paenibacillus alvei TaxID=44250 RepID=UPI00028A1CC1|nr:hypothetical protein [Paenibacillus alvei]EJW14746.1 hypothetical protein PAV_11c00870 [Paenibacillus alvei DSM 29]MCY9708154.1 hypothetical protein [Paenibacillus alvei]MEC0080213.1 hypothetical protein [Paenibacillus alvei]NEZ43332.1 hypothetical protein [Paenibacillus alvei]